MEYLSPYPSYIYNGALLQQGLAPENQTNSNHQAGAKRNNFLPIAELPKQQTKPPGSIPVHALGQVSRLSFPTPFMCTE